MFNVQLLSKLPQLAAPSDLEGRVVAALQAGHRQQRAVAAVASLARLAAPPVLARRLEAEFITKAPDVLLDRVEREFETLAVVESSRVDGGASKGTLRTVIAGVSLLLLALWALGPGEAVDRSNPVEAKVADRSPTYRFEIIRVASPRQAKLDAGIRQWIDGFAGGGLGSAD